MHWSATVAQMCAAILMTLLRVVLRLSITDGLISRSLPCDYELEWLSTRMARELDRDGKVPFWQNVVKGRTLEGPLIDPYWTEACVDWDVPMSLQVNMEIKTFYEDLAGAPQFPHTIMIKQRLVGLTGWESQTVDVAESLTKTINAILNMNTVQTSQLQRNTSFFWAMNAETLTGPCVLHFKINYDPGKIEHWSADATEIDATLSLWTFALESFHQQSHLPASKQIQLLSPCTKESYRDLSLWYEDTSDLTIIERFGCNQRPLSGIEGLSNISSQDFFGYASGNTPPF